MGIPIIELSENKLEEAQLIESPPEILSLEGKKIFNKDINSKTTNKFEGKLIVNKKLKLDKQQKIKEIIQSPDIKFITTKSKIKLEDKGGKNEDFWVINIPKVKPNSENEPIDSYRPMLNKFVPVLLKDLNSDKNQYDNNLWKKFGGYKKSNHLNKGPDIYIVTL